MRSRQQPQRVTRRSVTDYRLVLLQAHLALTVAVPELSRSGDSRSPGAEDT